MPGLIEYKDMAPRAKAVVEEIAARRGIDPANINNVWKALARHPAVMEQFAAEMKAAFAPGKLDPLTKELLYLAVSITNNCGYCINSHIAAARRKGMDDAVLAELNEIVALANAGNRLTQGLQVEVDDAFKRQDKPSAWKAPRSPAGKAAKARKRGRRK